MASNDDLLSWLEQELNSERETLHNHHQQQYEMLAERHAQLLAELAAKLCEGAAHQSTSMAEEPSSGSGQLEEKTNLTEETAPPPLLSTYEHDAPPSNEPPEAPISPAGSTPSRRTSQYKHQALRDMSGGSFAILEGDNLLKKIVKNHWFEAASCTLIILNTLLLIIEIEYHGFDSGNSVGYKGYRASEDVWPGATPWFKYLDYVFVSIFAVELLLRIGAYGLTYSVYSAWIWFDAIIVIASVVSWVIAGPDSDEKMDPSLLRIARLARMMRAFKVIRLVRAFDSLFLLVRSIQASVGALFWSFVLLLFLQVGIGMCLSQVLRQYIQDESHERSKRKEVFLYYGTFTRTMLTMFEITLGNWVPSCRTLMNNVSEWFALFYILYCCCFIFAVIRVVQAVFITETSRVAAADDQIALIKKQRDKSLYAKRLRMMFDELDLSGDGRLSREELKGLTEDKTLKNMMAILDINVHDLDTLFDLLDDGDGQIGIDEFILGLPRVKGGAQSIDVVNLLNLTQHLDKKADKILEKCSRGATSISRTSNALCSPKKSIPPLAKSATMPVSKNDGRENSKSSCWI